MQSSSVHRQCSKAAGFTLVEMLVVVPIVLLVIAALIGAMVAMVNDALVANGRAAAIYNAQDALTRIEQDVQVSTGFLVNFSYFDAKQSRDGTGSPFTTSSGDIILTQQATTASPYGTNRNLIYYQNQPNACTGDTSANRTLFSHTIYFTKPDPAQAGNLVLWRRTIVNTWNQKTTGPDANTVCTAPWQRDTCPTGSAIDGTICQAIDERLLDNVTNFSSIYYDAKGTQINTPSAATTIKISLSTSKQVATKTVAQASSVETTRLNDIPMPAAPATPSISLYNQALSTYNSSTRVTFQWNASGATSYSYSYSINGGSTWTVPIVTVNTTSPTITVTPSSKVIINVTGFNDNGTSSSSQYTYTTPAS